MKKVAILVLAGMVSVACAWGAEEWEHVGRIVTDGGPVPAGGQTLEVRLYDGASDGAVLLWGRKGHAQLDGDGNYSVRLGDALEALDGAPTNSLESVLAAGPVWVEVAVQGYPRALSPRAAVAATPYAFFAVGAEGGMDAFDMPADLVVEGKAAVRSIHVASALAGEKLDVDEKLAVKGNLTAGGGIKIPGMGPVPVGTIILFHGSREDIPAEWALCDGTKGTPDLRGRFVVGAGNSYESGSRGGDEDVALAVTNLAPHVHRYSQRPRHAAGDDWSTTMLRGNAGNTSTTVGPAGEQPDSYGQPHNNLPPYVALDYIMRVE